MSKMSKKRIKFKGVFLACCLAATAPLGAAMPIESQAMSVISKTVNITPPVGTSNISDYIETQIANALATDDVVRVTGHADIEDPSASSVKINIPQGKKVIWEASLSGKSDNPLLSIGSKDVGAQGDFEIISGVLKSETNAVISSMSLINDNINLSIKGGEIISGSMPDTPAVIFRGKGNFGMSGGKVINYGRANSAIVLLPSPSGAGNYSVTGGTIVSCGEKDLTNFRDNDGLISVSAPPYIDANINVDFQKVNLIAWNNTNASLTRYVNGGHDSRDLTVYPGSSTKASWTIVNGVAAIKYTNPNGDSGTVLQESAAVEDMNFPEISDSVYDKHEHGVNNFVAPDGSNVEFMYEGINGTDYSKKGDKPVNAGDYEVTAVLSSTYGNLNVNLGTLKISKRPVTIQLENKTIKENESLPPLPESFANLNIINMANGDKAEDVLNSIPQFTWNTDGKSAGNFNVGTLSPIDYKDNYIGGTQPLKGMLTVEAQSPQNPGNSQNQTNPNQGNPNPSTPQNPGNPGNGGNSVNPQAPTVPGTNPSQNNEKDKPKDNETKKPEDNRGKGQTNPEVKPDKEKDGGKRESIPVATPSQPKAPENRGRRRNGGGGRGTGGTGSGKKRSSGSSGNTKSAGNSNISSKGVWLSDNKGWWFKEADGSYPKSSWKQIMYNGINSWYYFDTQGYMVTGWKLIDGKWYYMYENTQGKNVKGSMAYNTSIQGYYVGTDGAWKN